MAKKIILSFVLLILIGALTYLFVWRRPYYSLAGCLDCSDSFNYSDFSSICVASSEEELMWYLDGFFRKPSSNNHPFDSSAINPLTFSFDWDKEDCVISYHRPIESLYWSPFLIYRNDGCYRWKTEIPLVSQLSDTITQKIYLYRIMPKYKFRGICP